MNLSYVSVESHGSGVDVADGWNYSIVARCCIVVEFDGWPSCEGCVIILQYFEKCRV